MENTISQLIKDISNEIYNTIHWSLKKFPLREQHCATYWINDDYNIFADTTIYDKKLLIKVERYDNDECVDDEVDSDLTNDLSYTSILSIVENIMKHCIENNLIEL